MMRDVPRRARQGPQRDARRASRSYMPPAARASAGRRTWAGRDEPRRETGVPIARAAGARAEALTTCPTGFKVHPHSSRASLADRARDGATRRAAARLGHGRDARLSRRCSPRATRVRLSGQDSGRGTFSHRHAVLHDARTGADVHAAAAPRAREQQAAFEVYDSPLSEDGGARLRVRLRPADPDALVIWEAQFGDFANGAQVIIDQFIAGGEAKWGALCGLVLLLPHGYEGQGPEHSSARLGALPAAVRRGQHAGLQPDHAGADLPPAAPPDACGRSASR